MDAGTGGMDAESCGKASGSCAIDPGSCIIADAVCARVGDGFGKDDSRLGMFGGGTCGNAAFAAGKAGGTCGEAF
jgi:hypothetical protein